MVQNVIIRKVICLSKRCSCWNKRIKLSEQQALRALHRVLLDTFAQDVHYLGLQVIYSTHIAQLQTISTCLTTDP